MFVYDFMNLTMSPYAWRLVFLKQFHQKMSAPVGPRGGPTAPPAADAQPEMPDLSHLTEEERKIILSVMDRQKKEEEKEQSMLK